MGLDKFEEINDCLNAVENEVVNKGRIDLDVKSFLIKEINERNLKSLIKKFGISKSEYVLWVMKNKLYSAGFAMQLYEEVFD